MTTHQQLLSDVIRLVNHQTLAMLTTVDAQGVPHARWMGVAAMDGVRRLYTLSGRSARKIEQIRNNPKVCWTFTDPEFNEVATLYGDASVVDSPVFAQGAWDLLASNARNYTMSAVSDDENLELCSIETIVTRVELVSPKRQLFHPVEVTLSNKPT